MPTGEYNISGRLPNKKLGVAASQKLSVATRGTHKISTSVDTNDLAAITKSNLQIKQLLTQRGAKDSILL